MNLKEKDFYTRQCELIDKALEILEKEMPKYREDYKELYYQKKVPPHIMQSLQALRSKIFFKPIYNKIKTELKYSTIRDVRNLIDKY